MHKMHLVNIANVPSSRGSAKASSPKQTDNICARKYCSRLNMVLHTSKHGSCYIKNSSGHRFGWGMGGTCGDWVGWCGGWRVRVTWNSWMFFTEGHMWRNIFTNLQVWIQIKKAGGIGRRAQGLPPKAERQFLCSRLLLWVEYLWYSWFTYIFVRILHVHTYTYFFLHSDTQGIYNTKISYCEHLIWKKQYIKIHQVDLVGKTLCGGVRWGVGSKRIG